MRRLFALVGTSFGAGDDDARRPGRKSALAHSADSQASAGGGRITAAGE